MRVKGQATVFNYMSELHLDQMMPTYIGLRTYGYLKDLAKIDRAEARVSVADALTGQVLLNQSTSRLATTNSAQFQSHWKLVEGIFARPVISNLNGTLLCSVFKFQHLESHAVGMQVQFAKPNLGMTTLNAAGLDQAAFAGAFHYESGYTLSAPVPAAQCR